MNNQYSISEYAYLAKEKVKKNIYSTFLPYQDIKPILNSLLQPFYGLKYLSIGLFLLILSIILFPGSVYFAIKNKSFKELTGFLFLSAIQFLLIGLGLLLTSPLVLFVQMPIRVLFNILLGGWGRIEDGYHIRRIISEAEQAITEGDKRAIITTTSLLHIKFQRNYHRKHRCTDINIDEEQNSYMSLDKDFVLGTLNVASETPITETQKNHLQSYLSLFKKSSSSDSGFEAEKQKITTRIALVQ